MKLSFSRRRFVLGVFLALVSATALWKISREPTPAPFVSAQSSVAPRLASATSARSVASEVTAFASTASAPAPAPQAAVSPGAGNASSSARLWAPVSDVQGAKLQVDPATPSRGVGGESTGRSARFDAASLRTLVDLRPGEAVMLPLLGGEEVSGRVNLVQAEGGKWIRVGGELTGARHGSFALNTDGAEVGGTILLPEEGLAMVIAEQADGRVTMEEKPLGEILCTPMPVPFAAIAAPAETDPVTPPAAAPIPVLSSRPGATAVIYLDFDGETVTDPRWAGGQTIVAAAPNVSAAEITQAWASVKEDYWAFNVDVTTDLNRYTSAPVNRRTRCIITPTDTAAPGSGGVAYINCFSRGGTSTFSATIPCWVFVGGAKPIAEAVAHEVGHTLGLRHDGRTGEEYYAGHGGGTVGWAPIMGVGYYREVVQWSKGEYPNASNLEDDLAIITSATNGLGYVADEAGNTRAAAAPLGISGNTINQSGIITQSSDADYYVVTIGGGSNVSLAGNPAAVAPDLDLVLELQDANGNILATANPDLALNAAINTFLAAGTYYVKVQGTGRGNLTVDGYSNYASIGAYTLTGTLSGAAQAPTISGLTNQNAVAGTPTSPIGFTVADADTNVNLLTLSATSSNQTVVPNAAISFGGSGAARTITLAPAVGQTGNPTITVTVSDGALTSSASFVVTVTAPGSQPVFTLNPASQTVLVGGSASFSAAASGTPAPSYQWLKNSAPIGGATNPTFTIPVVSLGDAGTYAVTASNAAGSATSAPATLTVNNAAPNSPLLSGTTISTAPYGNSPAYAGANVFDGNGATFFAGRPEDAFVYVGRNLGTAKIVDRIRYLPRSGFNWRMTGGVFRGANAADLSDAVTLYTIGATPPEGLWQDVTLPASSASYRYVFFTTTSVNEANIAELELYGTAPAVAPPQITSQPQSQTVNAGASVLFSVATDALNPAYQWYKNNAPLGGATAASFGIAAVSSGDAGNYTVRATNAGGSVTSNIATLTVNGAPNPSGLLGGATISTAPYDNNPAYAGTNAFDGNGGTFFAGRPTDPFVFVGRDFGVAKRVDRLRYLPRAGYSGRMNGGMFRGANSADLSDAVTLHTIVFTPPEGVWQDVTLPVAAAGYRYVFFTTASSNEANIAELELYGSAVAASALLGGTTISTAPYDNNAAYQGSNVFDGNGTTFFAGRSGDALVYVGRDLGAAKTIDRIRYLPRTGFNWRMTGGEFRGANAANLSDAVTLHTIAFTPPEGVWQDVTLPATSAGYRYVFFTTISNNEANIAELEFYGSAAAAAEPSSNSAINENSDEVGLRERHTAAQRSGDSKPPVSPQSRSASVALIAFVPEDATRVEFTIEGDRPVTVLIRAIGLAPETPGERIALAPPQLDLFWDELLIASNCDRDTAPDAGEIASFIETAGIFPPADENRESAILKTLLPGTYTAALTDPAQGAGLIEVYRLPIAPARGR